MNRKSKWIGFSFLLATSLSLAELCCKTGSDEGRQLAETYCGSRHLFPKPELLPKEVWQTNVLPAMMPHLGLSAPSNLSADERKRVNPAGVYPSQPMPGKVAFGKILQFYLDHAPASLPANEVQNFSPLEKKFKPVSVKLPPGASVTTLHFDSSENTLLAGFQNGMLLVLNDKFAVADTFKVSHSASDAKVVDGKLAILEIGRLLPSDLFHGRLTAKNFHRRPAILAARTQPPGRISIRQSAWQRPARNDCLRIWQPGRQSFLVRN